MTTVHQGVNRAISWRSKLPSNKLIASYSFFVVLLAIFLKHLAFDDDPNKCQALATTGQWSHKNTGHEWLVDGCNQVPYGGDDIKACVGEKDQKIIFAGDSQLQMAYWRFAKRLDSDIEPVAHPVQKDLKVSRGHVELQYLYDPYLNSTSLLDYVAQHQAGNQDRPLLTVIGAANYHIEKGLTDEYVKTVDSFARSTTTIGSRFSYDDGPGDLLLFAPAQPPYSPNPASDALVQPFRDLNARLDQLDHANMMSSFVKLTEGRRDMYDKQGTNITREVSIIQADLLLNLRCNAITRKNRTIGSCCNAWRWPNWIQGTFLITGFVLLPMILLADLRLHFWSKNFRKVTTAFAAFSIVVGLQYIADRTHVFEQGTRLGLVRNDLYAMIVVTFVVGFVTIRRCQGRKPESGQKPSNQPFLPRDQTDEWKGWMQALIIIYHYNKGWEFLEFWQLIRLSVASYLFLTGFGHTVYFLQKDDYSLKRFTNVMIRTNLLAVTLAYVMRTKWVLYYYMPLSTFWFVTVYLTMALGRSHNKSHVFVIAKIALSAFLVRAFLSTRDLPETIVRLSAIVFKTKIDAREFFHHRVESDRYIVYAGMLAAILYMCIRDALAAETSQSRIASWLRRRWPWLKWSTITLALPIMIGYWVYSSTFIKTANDFSARQPFISPIAILAFAILRNAHPALRNYHSAAFAWLGRYSGEMYVMQDHLWLAADQEAILHTGFFRGNGTLRGDRWRDLVVITPMYLFACSVVGDATGVIANWFITEKSPAEMGQIVVKKPESEMEMGLLADEGVFEVETLQFSEKPKPWWKSFSIKLWPSTLRNRVFLVLGILWGLNLTYT